jgi:hypothetical protein
MKTSIQSESTEQRFARWGIVLILLAFAAVALAYSIVNPLHESTDELRHYRFVRIISTTGRLPVQGQEECRSQSHHPPLIYGLGALATFWIDTGRDICYTPPENPFWAFRYWEVGQDNKNQYLHGNDEAFPWHGEALAVHIIRAVNVLIGTGVVWLTWATSRVIWPKRTAMALGAAAFVAFNPMFLYMSGGINNDVIAAFSGAAVIYACIRLLDKPQSLNWRWGLVFGGLYGLALMSKFNLAPIVVLVAATIGWTAWQKGESADRPPEDEGTNSFGRSRWRRTLRLWLPVMIVTLVIAGLVAGWWFLRNQILYGEPTGFRELTELWGVRNPIDSFGLAISELPYAWTTLWGRFGFGQIPLPAAIYNGLKVVVGAGLIGTILGFFRADSRLRAMLLLLAANLLLFLAVLFNYMLVSPAGPNGRFVFPALSSLAILTFFGLAWWAMTTRTFAASHRRQSQNEKSSERRLINALSFVVTLTMLALSIWVLVGYLAPAYARPDTIADGESIPNPVIIQFDNLVTLLGYDVNKTSFQPGESLDVSLYWQVDAQPPGNYLLFLHLMDSAGTMVAQRDTHPGLGNFPSSLWQPGDRFVDHIRLYVPETAYAPETGTLSIGLYAPDSYRLAVSDASGQAIGDSYTLAKVAIESPQGEFANAQSQDFANDILLTGYEYDRRVLEAGDTLQVTLQWQALRDVDADYLVRLWLLDDEGHEVAGVERRPNSDDSSTSFWNAGQIVSDTFDLALPEELSPGRYLVNLALIDTATGEVVHILAEDGHQVNSLLSLAEIRVAAE